MSQDKEIPDRRLRGALLAYFLLLAIAVLNPQPLHPS
jgi:hypothetical protein